MTDIRVTEADDDALALAARQDAAAFAELYRRHLNRVYRYLLARVGDVHGAQDLTAQPFLAALEHINSYRGQGGFVAWLLTIARNKAADSFRRSRTTLPLEAALDLEHPDPTPEHVVTERLELEQVTRALRAIAHDRAEALTLRLFGGLSVTEVSRIMGRSEASVKMLLHRAMRDLRERLAWNGEAEP